MDSGLAEVLLGAPALETLSLKGSRVDCEDPFRSLALSQESADILVAAVSMFRVLDRCPALLTLDLTGTRGVPLKDRRRFFDVSSSLPLPTDAR